MAVMQNSIIFGGINSADFGIYIGGEGTFNAPKRAVEMVTVPGRNGDIAIDQGHYENIKVTYSAFNYEEDLATFAKQLSDFRNAIVSQVGYQRLTDTFHPDEYRMAIYTEGLEIDPIKYNTASEFELKFNCKPQRWLTAGEVPVTIGEWGATKEASGEIVTIESEGGEAAKSLEVSLEPIQAGSGEPSPSNVRAISGRTEVVTRVAGKNLLPIIEQTATTVGVTATVNADGSVTLNGTATGNGGILLTESSSGKWLTEGTYYGKLFGNNLEGLSFQVYNNGHAIMTRPSGSFVIPSDSEINYIRVRWASGTVFDNVTVYPMLILGTEEPTTYIAPQTKTFTTAFGRTVYGGTLDVVSGVLTVDTMYSSTTWSAMDYPEVIGTMERRRWRIGTNMLASQVKGVSNIAPWSAGGYAQDRGMRWYNDAASGFFYLPPNTDGNTAIEAVFKLATPQTYQLTPQQVELLVGENHVWSDGSITMQYGTDPNALCNPTQYESGPLIAVEGYGNIIFNGFTIEIESGDYGVITIAENDTFYKGGYSITIPAEYIKNGDVVTLSGVELTCPVVFKDSSGYKFYGDGRTPSPAPTDSVASATTVFDDGLGPIAHYGADGYRIKTTIPSISFTIGTNETFRDVITIAGLKVTADRGATLLAEITNTITETVTYDATTQTITFTQAVTTTQFDDELSFNSFGYSNWPSSVKSAQINSTLTYLGTPTYIDCEIGEAYKIEDDVVISLNRYIDLGSDLPTLASGANGITADNTIESLKITPRWWRL